MLRPLSALPQQLGVTITDMALLRSALMHQSYRYEHGEEALLHADTQRLEFLGDAIVAMVATQLIYTAFPTANEGTMTRLRSALIRTENLATIARHYDLGDYAIIGKGEEHAGARQRTTFLADLFESIVAVIYIDQGLTVVTDFLMRHYEPHVEILRASGTPTDVRSLIQELSQQRFNITPIYRIVSVTGPEHQREFVVEIVVGTHVLGCGQGNSQPTARIQAAQLAIDFLVVNPLFKP
ncbi:MAG: ribonuclease III [Chloroflexales bacterium]|nr:ribonuclease III [Chloroflexales bacterium]